MRIESNLNYINFQIKLTTEHKIFHLLQASRKIKTADAGDLKLERGGSWIMGYCEVKAEMSGSTQQVRQVASVERER